MSTLRQATFAYDPKPFFDHVGVWKAIYGDAHVFSDNLFKTFDADSEKIEEKFDTTTSIAKLQNTLQGINLFGSKRVVK